MKVLRVNQLMVVIFVYAQWPFKLMRFRNYRLTDTFSNEKFS